MAITVAQTVSTGTHTNSGTALASTAFSSNITAGNTIISIWAASSTFGTFSSASDNLGNTYALDKGNGANNNASVYIISAHNVTGGASCVITFHTGQGIPCALSFIGAIEVSGLLNSGFADGTGGTQGPGAGLNTGTFSTTKNANDLIVGALASNTLGGAATDPAEIPNRICYLNGQTTSNGITSYGIKSTLQSSINPTWAGGISGSNNVGVAFAYQAAYAGAVIASATAAAGSQDIATATGTATIAATSISLGINNERFGNRAITTLNGDISSGTNTIAVTSAADFPPSPQFRIVVDTEIMVVTAVSGNTFTVARGQESTSATTHSNLSTVAHVLTSGAIDQYRTNNIMSGTYSNLPTATRTGRIYLPTDSPYTLYDNGTSWVAMVNGNSCTIPNFSGYTWTNQSTATTNVSQGYTFLSEAVGSSGGLRILKKSIPIATSYTYTTGFTPLLHGSGVGNAGNASMGLVVLNSGSGKIITFALSWKRVSPSLVSDTQPVMGLLVWDWNSATAASLFPFFQWIPNPSPNVGWYFQITDDGTSRYYNFGFDGVNFTTAYKEARTNFITPDQYGVYIDANAATGTIGQSIFHCLEQ